MASPSNVELEAAKFLHKLIQDSKDEPAKLATKLFVILQHMKSSGKEHSMPYQVISRAMETVISQNGIDIEALKSSRLPLTSGTQIGDSLTTQCAGSSSQGVGAAKDSKAGLVENETSKIDPFTSSRTLVGPSSTGHDYYQVAGTHKRGQSFDHESPSSLDTRSANSQSQERQKDGKKSSAKRKRGDSSISREPQNENPQPLDSSNPVVNPRKGKMNKVESSAGFPVKGGEHSNFNVVPSGGQMEHFSSLSGNMSSIHGVKQEGQNATEKPVVSANTSNSMSRAPNSKFPQEVEVSSSLPQQGSSLSSTNDVLAARAVWNQNKAGFPFERSQFPRFTGNMMTDTLMQQPTVSSLAANAFGKVHGGMPVGPSSYPTGESGSSTLSPVESQLLSTNRGDETSVVLSSGKSLEHDGSLNMLGDANRVVQVGRQNSISGTTMLRTTPSRDTGRPSLSQASVLSGMPFKEQQLKQLRAQCLVFLAFRNGLVPKKLHLEIALGNIFPREGGNVDGSRRELIDNHTGKAQTLNDPSSISGVVAPYGRPGNAREADRILLGASSSGRFLDADSSSKEAENLKMEDKSGPSADHSLFAKEGKQQATRKLEAELQSHETAESQALLTSAVQHPESVSTRGGLTVTNPVNDMENGHLVVGRANVPSSLMGINKPMNTEINSWTGISSQNEVPRRPLPASTVQHELVKDNAHSQFQSVGNSGASGNQHTSSHLSSFIVRDQWKPVPGTDNDHRAVIPTKDASGMLKHMSQEQDEEDKSMHPDAAPSPKYTMSEKWIMDMQKRKLLVEQNWIMKQQKTKQRISSCFHKLKENVSSSEDISAKTKSVIELKKLQLLGLQRRLRSDFLNDFFKPITTDMDRLKSYKKHRHGRRIKQLEKFEQKMKEERQKRIRERQKEFFSEIEVHKERLDEVFKSKRERWRGVNKYVKEFHKRKERIHREKIDRIQREKINLLKINDVEGYLRMVQDAKSDRVKQLLKETEKYLQKLGSKLQEAKAVASSFEQNMDDARTSSVIENYETAVENEDESDQAKHYLESNEKYYLMAHSIKENISEQPTCLHGGKLREYQMNGLRWLVSLYNNHLNGILADEMGLGKTVQVIALICYLMEAKNDRGPFLVVVPSSVLPGWETEINFWAPSIHKIVYSGPPEERRRLFKEQIVHQKFNVLLTTYEYLMNKHDRPKLSKIQWHYIIIDEGHRIKNASCKLNADLKHYQSFHRLLLSGTPLQNNLEELWALLNFLLPNIFNSSEDFSQWFNKPFESNGDNSPDEALLSEEENLLIINRLHQVLRPFVLRRLKHKVENELPEKIERLIRCEASAYQKLLMKRVEENLGSIGNSKARSVHNSVMELRNICNHPYISQLHAEEVDTLIPKHYLPPIVRLCGKLEMLDRLLPKLKATDHRVLFFSTMTRLLDVMEDYLTFKQYRYLRLDGHTSGADRGALIENFNKPGSPFFIFLLSIRAGGVGVNLQAADTVIIFDTDWNPQVDLQAQARAHRIGQKRDVLVLRFETVQTVEEQVRASAEHKLGVANQSITAGFFDNNTSAEDRREYLESLLRESKKEEAAPVLDDDALNDLIARSESEIDIFESVDNQRREEEMATWKKLIWGQGRDTSEALPLLPSRLVTDDDLKSFYEAMKIYDVPKAGVSPNVGVKRKGECLGALDTQQYGRGKRAREVRSYEEQWTEEEFEKLCQADSPDSPKLKEEGTEKNLPTIVGESAPAVECKEPPVLHHPPAPPSLDPPQPLQSKEVTPPSKRGRGRPRRADKSPVAVVLSAPSGTGQVDTGLQREAMTSSSAASGTGKVDTGLQREAMTSSSATSVSDSLPGCLSASAVTESVQHSTVGVAPSSQPTTPLVSVTPGSQSAPICPSIPMQPKGRGRKIQSGEQGPRRRGKKVSSVLPAASDALPSPGPGLGPGPKINEQPHTESINPSGHQATVTGGTASSVPTAPVPDPVPSSAVMDLNATIQPSAAGAALNSETATHFATVPPDPQLSPNCPSVPLQTKGQSRKTQGGVVAPRRRGKRQASVAPSLSDVSAGLAVKSDLQQVNISGDLSESKSVSVGSKQDTVTQELSNVIQVQTCGVNASTGDAAPDQKSLKQSDCIVQYQQPTSLSAALDSASFPSSPASGQVQSVNLHNGASGTKEVLCEHASLKGSGVPALALSDKTAVEENKTNSSEDKACTHAATVKAVLPAVGPLTDPYTGSTTVEGTSKTMHHVSGAVAPRTHSVFPCPSVPEASQSNPPQASASVPVKRQGRKSPTAGEAPRRRGKKQGLGIVSIPDGTAHLDAKFNQQSQNKLRESFGCKTVALRSKQETADVNDVARVMKEIFSETCSSKAKTSDFSSNEGRDASVRAVTSNTVAEVAKSHSSDDKKHIGMPTVEAVPPGFDIPIERHKQQLGTEGDVGAKGENTPVSRETLTAKIEAFKVENKAVENLADSILDDRTHPVMPTSETAPPGFDNAIEKNKEESGTESDGKGEDTLSGEALASKTEVFEQENKIDAVSIENMVDSSSDGKMLAVTPAFETPPPHFDIAIEMCKEQSGTESDVKGIGEHTPLFGEAHASETEAFKPKIKIDSGSVENLADSRQLSNETSTVRSMSEDVCIIPPNASEKMVVPSQSTVELPGRKDNDFGNIALTASKGSSKSPAVVASCTESPTICITADNASDHHRASLHVSSMMDPPGTIEFSSGNISEPSLKESLQSSPLAVSSLEASSVPRKVDTVGDHSQSTTLMPGSKGHSGMMSMCGVPANSSEFSSKVPLEGAECSSETIVERHEVLGKTNDPGIPLELSEIATSCNTASLDDSPDKFNIEALSGGNGDKADSTLEPFCLVASESKNLEMVSGDHGVEKSNGDMSMEVDPSNTRASSPKDIVVESAEVDFILDDHGRTQLLPGVENTEGGEILLHHMSENEGEKVDVSSDKGAIGRMLVLQDFKFSSGNESEPSLKESLRSSPLAVSRLEASSVSTEVDTRVTALMPGSTDHSGMVGSPGMIGIRVNKSEFSSEMPMEGDEDSSENIVERQEVIGEVSDPGIPLELSDIATICNTASLDDSPDKCNTVALAGGSGDKGDCTQEPVGLVASESTNLEMVPRDRGVEKNDGDINMEVDPSNTRASFPKDIVAESAKADIIPDDHGKMQVLLGVENTEGGEIVPQHMSESKGETVDVLSEKGAIGSTLSLEDFKVSEAETGDRIDVSQVGGSSPRSISGNSALPSSSFTTEKENVEVGPVGSSESLRDFKGSEAQVGGKVDVSPVSGVNKENLSESSDIHSCLLVTMEEKQEALSREDVVCCSVAEDGHQVGVSQGGEVVPGKLSEDLVLPPSSFATEEEKVEGYPDQDNVSSLVVLQNSYGSIDEAGAEMDNCQSGAVVLENLDDLGLASASLVTEEGKIEPSVEKGPVSRSLVGPQFAKESLAEAGDQEGVSQVGVVVPANSSEELLLATSSMATKEGNVQGSLEKGPVSSLMALEDSKGYVGEVGDQMDNSQNAVVVHKKLSNLGLLASSLEAEEAKIEETSEKDPVSSVAAMEDSKTAVAEAGDQMDVSWSSDVVLDKSSEDMGLPSSSLVAGVKKIDDFSEKDPVSSLVPVEDLKRFESEACDQIHVSQGGIIVPETVPEESGLPSSSLAIDEEKIEGSSEKEPVGSSTSLNKSKWSESEAYKPMDVEGGGVVLENVLQSVARLSSSLVMVEEKTENQTERDPVLNSIAVEESRESVDQTEDNSVINGLVAADESRGSEDKAAKDSVINDSIAAEESRVPEDQAETDYVINDSVAREESSGSEDRVETDSVINDSVAAEESRGSEDRVEMDSVINDSVAGEESRGLNDRAGTDSVINDSVAAEESRGSEDLAETDSVINDSVAWEESRGSEGRAKTDSVIHDPFAVEESIGSEGRAETDSVIRDPVAVEESNGSEGRAEMDSVINDSVAEEESRGS